MALTFTAQAIPLRWKDGIIYMSNTRIPVDTVIYAYQRGDTPERIVEGFPTLKLADVYAVIAYYLEHREELDVYLRDAEARAEAIVQENERRHPTDGLREKLLQRLEAKKRQTE
jgi:uncharacterized protein (DUF433 family)